MSVKDITLERFERAKSAADVKAFNVLDIAKRYIEQDEKTGHRLSGMIICLRHVAEDGEIFDSYVAGGEGVDHKRDAVGLLEYTKLKLFRSEVE